MIAVDSNVAWAIGIVVLVVVMGIYGIGRFVIDYVREHRNVRWYDMPSKKRGVRDGRR